MSSRLSLHRMRAVLGTELNAIRRRSPDVDPADIAGFTLPLLVRAAGVLAVGMVPLLVIRNGSEDNAELVPILSSIALMVICAAVVSWLMSVVLSGLVVMILYRTRASTSSHLVMRILRESFRRVDDTTSALVLLVLVAGMLSLAFGLPIRSGDDQANSVLDDLLAAQLGVLIFALGFAFLAESIRSAADIVDDQSPLLAWPWALLIASLSWVLATVAGPFEATRMLSILLHDWLPAEVDGIPRDELIAEMVPAGARWWLAFGPLPAIAALWAYEAWHNGGLVALRTFLSASTPDDRDDKQELIS
ncbi:MAG: hypothetical protein U0R77_05905 [Mycolicibacterium insubricum]